MTALNILDIIDKKRRNLTLNDQEIAFAVLAFNNGQIPDYQMAALLMAMSINGLSLDETSAFTRALVDSGKTYDFHERFGNLVDKHSTGGIGDKVTLILGPLMAALDVPMFKISGASLGLTGGTLDKLHAIRHMKSTLSDEEIVAQLTTVGFVLVGQSDDLVPADRAIYALRGVTATVSALPLIAASIMSKKIALGASVILLDIKCGDGAFVQSLTQARALAKLMQQIGVKSGRKVLWKITNMNTPLGRAVGNSLEVLEAQSFLQNYRLAAADLTEVVLASATALLQAVGKAKTIQEAETMIKKALEEHRAFNKWLEFVSAQGGDLTALPNVNEFKVTGRYYHNVLAMQAGYLEIFSAGAFGNAHRVLGGLRTLLNAAVDNEAGVYLHYKTGDQVAIGQVLFTLSSSSPILQEAIDWINGAYRINTNWSEHQVILERG